MVSAFMPVPEQPRWSAESRQDVRIVIDDWLAQWPQGGICDIVQKSIRARDDWSSGNINAAVKGELSVRCRSDEAQHRYCSPDGLHVASWNLTDGGLLG